MNVKSDSELVKAVLDGDRQAYGRLFERYERSVQAVALAVLGDYHAAQEAVQESFLKAYTKLSGLRKGSSFGPWIRTIARREAIQIRRSRLRREDAKQHVIHVDAVSSDGQIDEQNRRLLQVIMRLPEHEREAVMLRYFDDHSVKKISEMTGRPVGNVTMQLSRARRRLRKWLKEK